MKKFTIGETATWNSQANGSYTIKTGPVVEVVQPGKLPATQGLKECGMPRPIESYVIHVPTKTGKGNGKYYWPIVSKLSKVNP